MVVVSIAASAWEWCAVRSSERCEVKELLVGSEQDAVTGY